ncbi:MAG TPA: hypothetical protein VK464_00845, partial [Symbiobacteriaceae bacterium]|nr:hypothetical protein [Symbiobacteriaceae bacterium]
MLKAAVDFAPAYELLMSLELYCGGQKIADLGGDWSAQVRSGLTPDLIARLDGLKEAEELSLLGLLVWQCPDRATVGSFIAWLAARSPGELYERLAPYVPDAMSAVLRNLGGVRDEWVGLLSDWDAQYFRTVSPSLLTALEAECGARQAQVSAADPAGFVEATTGGLQVEPLPGLALVLLVPQHHYRPSNYYQRLGAVLMIYY